MISNGITPSFIGYSPERTIRHFNYELGGIILQEDVVILSDDSIAFIVDSIKELGVKQDARMDKFELKIDDLKQDFNNYRVEMAENTIKKPDCQKCKKDNDSDLSKLEQKFQEHINNERATMFKIASMTGGLVLVIIAIVELAIKFI